jgi:hypothetical protein
MAAPAVPAFLRCTSVRFTCYYVLAFYAGLGAAAADRPEWLAFGVAYWFVHSTVTELLNRLADRVPDEVNRPERTALCAQVGWDRLRALAVGGYALLLLLGTGWLLAVPTAAVAGLLVLAAFLCLNYSYGLRLGRSRFGSLVVLAFPFVGCYTGGWALAHPDAGWGDFATGAGPILLVGGLALASLSGAKDLTDIVGDVLKDYRSGWLWLVRGRMPAVGAAVAAVPFAVLGAFVAAGALAPRHLALLALLPAALLLTSGSRLARGPDEQMAVREFFYHYWVAFLAVLVLCHVPSALSVAVVAAGLAAWRLATVHLHWLPARSPAAAVRGWLSTVLLLHRPATYGR